MFKNVRIKPHEIGLQFHKDAFDRVLPAGDYRYWDPLGRVRVDVVNLRNIVATSEHTELFLKDELSAYTQRVEVADHERLLVWVDGRFVAIFAPGTHGFWTSLKKVRTEIVDVRNVRFEHGDFDAIVPTATGQVFLDVTTIPPDSVGVLYLNGKYVETLNAGRYAFWKNRTPVKVEIVNRKEQMLDVPGQEILTADRVTLRMTAVAIYRVADAVRSVTATDNASQALYREVQLAIRSAVGVRTLDQFLSDKTSLATDLTETVKSKAAGFGLDVSTVGIKDVILPGEMKTLLNKVIEARTAAEAAVITRREEAQALRHQANTAKLLTETPALMKLRELEAMERIAAAGKLNIVLGEKGLAEKMTMLV